MPRKAVAVGNATFTPPSRYAQLTNDHAFKKAFATEGDEEQLAKMLNVFLEKKLAHPIKNVTIKNPYMPGEMKKNRDAVLDINCEDTKGNKFIVEMQVNPQKLFVKRAIFYTGVSIAKSGKKGKNWDFNFPNTYSLNFLDFEPYLEGNHNNIIRYVSLHDDDYPEIKYDYIGLAFIILPRFKKAVEKCLSFQDQLLFSLRYAHTLGSKPKHFKGKFFDRLFDLAKFSNFTDMEYSLYTARMMAKADRKAQLEYAEEKGVIRVARNMLKEGSNLAFIARVTNLPKEQIIALR